MKPIILTGVLLFFVLFPAYFSYESPIEGLEPLEVVAPLDGERLFEPGEVAQFNIKCFFAKVGEGKIEYLGREVLDGVPVHHVRSSFSHLGAVDDEDIYGTADGFLPLIVKRRIDTLGDLRVETETYDQENFSIEINRKKGGTVERELLSSDERIQNLILLFFDLRQRALEPGARIPVNLPRQKFVLEVREPTEVQVPYGSFKAYELSSDGGELRVWVSAGDNPFIVKAMIKSPLFGHYSLVLTGLGRRKA